MDSDEIRTMDLTMQRKDITLERSQVFAMNGIQYVAPVGDNQIEVLANVGLVIIQSPVYKFDKNKRLGNLCAGKVFLPMHEVQRVEGGFRPAVDETK